MLPVQNVTYVSACTGMVSFNYDYRFLERWSVRLSPYGGFGGLSDSEGYEFAFFTVNYLPLCDGAHCLETGLGPMLSWETAPPVTRLGVTGQLVYRYQPSPGGFFFRAGLTASSNFAAIGEGCMGGVFPNLCGIWLGVSLGGTFTL